MTKALALTVLSLSAAVLQADDWPGPRRVEVFSASGERFVRIIPGESLGETFGFAGAPKGRHARAEHYERRPDRSFTLVAEFELANPVAPVDALLSDSGVLITFDNWHNAGYGKVVALYAADGARIEAYELEDLYEDPGMRELPQSESSRWWRCGPLGWSDPEERTMAFVHERRGGRFIFDLTAGSQRYEPGSSKCQE